MNETKKTILKVAKQLFSEKDFENVTVREIAKKANISHTTLYLYFKTKHELVLAIALEPLEALFDKLSKIETSQMSRKKKCLDICNQYINFGFEQKSIYKLISLYEGERVDLTEYDSPISQLRMNCFVILKDTIFELLPKNLKENQKINVVRGTFFFLHGIIMTYMNVNENEIVRIEGMVRDYLEFTIL